MGRYYCGQITGKFWFGVQSSSDASYFGVKHKDIVQYQVCGCELDESYIDHVIENETLYIKINRDGLFCEDCFETFDEHKQALVDDDIIFDGNNWYISDHEIYYQFEITDINVVTSQIQKLEHVVGKHMTSYKINDENGEITYNYSDPKNLTADELVLVARLCLGKQILYCLQTYGTCYFSAEL